MSYLVAFLTGALVTLVEVSSRYQRAPRQALLNPWALSLIFINGMASTGVYSLMSTTKIVEFYITSDLVKAFVVGVGWQLLLRSKLFSLADVETGKDIQVGLEHFHKKYTAIFESQIDAAEERSVLIAIRDSLKSQDMPVERVREIALDFIDYKQARKKITKTEAGELREFVRKSKPANIMYLVFEMSNLKTLQHLFSVN